MTASKLPEWPVRRAWGLSVEERALYLLDLSEAALARMEALVERVRHEPNCPVARMRGVVMPRPECSCGLDELLAACERSRS